MLNKFSRKLILKVLLLISAFSVSATEVSGNVVGTYTQESDGMYNYMQLREDGRAVLVTEKKDGKWVLVMLFKWSLDGNTFHQKDITWSGNGSKWAKSADEWSAIKVDGKKAIEVFMKQTFTWERWEKTDRDLFGEVMDSANISVGNF